MDDFKCRIHGYRYQESMLQLRIDTEFLEAKDIKEKPVSESYIKRVIDLTKNDKFKENPGLQHWGISHNNLAISQTIYRLYQLGIGSFKQLENYISQTTLSLDNNKKELVKLEKEASDILELKELLDKLKNEGLDNDVLLSMIDNLTSNKPNEGLEKIIRVLQNKEINLIDKKQLNYMISELDEQYNHIRIKVTDLKSEMNLMYKYNHKHKQLMKNYTLFLNTDKNNMLNYDAYSSEFRRSDNLGHE